MKILDLCQSVLAIDPQPHRTAACLRYDGNLKNSRVFNLPILLKRRVFRIKNIIILPAF